MGEPGAVVVAGAVEKNLGLAIESPEGCAMDNPCAVALDFGTVGMLLFAEAAASRALRGNCVACQLERFFSFKIFSRAVAWFHMRAYRMAFPVVGSKS